MDIFEFATLCNLDESWVTDSLCEAFVDLPEPALKQGILFPKIGTISGKFRYDDDDIMQHYTRFTKAAAKHFKLPEPVSHLWFHGTSADKPYLAPMESLRYKLSSMTPEDVNKVIGPHFANNLGTSFKEFTPMGRRGYGDETNGSIIVGHILGKPEHYGSEADLNDILDSHVWGVLRREPKYSGITPNHSGLLVVDRLANRSEPNQALLANRALRAGAASLRNDFKRRGVVPVYKNEYEPGHAAILPSYKNFSWVTTLGPDDLATLSDIYSDTM